MVLLCESEGFSCFSGMLLCVRGRDGRLEASVLVEAQRSVESDAELADIEYSVLESGKGLKGVAIDSVIFQSIVMIHRNAPPKNQESCQGQH